MHDYLGCTITVQVVNNLYINDVGGGPIVGRAGVVIRERIASLHPSSAQTVLTHYCELGCSIAVNVW